MSNLSLNRFFITHTWWRPKIPTVYLIDNEEEKVNTRCDYNHIEEQLLLILLQLLLFIVTIIITIIREQMILVAKNVYVDEINFTIQEMFPGELISFKSIWNINKMNMKF